MPPKLSVIVCTYNRSSWLRRCLASLEPQCSDGGVVEVLIVDNNSPDDTRKVAEEYTSRMQHFRYIYEKAQGLSHARNRGYRESRGQFVAYLDDDAKAHADWVASIIQFFETLPEASGVGGPYKSFSPVPPPLWFPKEYGCWSLGAKTRKLKENEYVNGANMAFTKQALIALGGFDTTIGMTGSKVSYGEETNLTMRMRECGRSVYYCPKMVVDHAILPYKQHLGWLLKSSFANGYDGVTTLNYQGGARAYLGVLIRQTLVAGRQFLFSKERYVRTRLYRSLGPLLWHIGFFIRLIGL